ncbi:MAG: recombinase family protein [Chloroflexi bacterium]|nr:MAG: recombinase family protein [Chloroflexota bacterium]
MTRKAVIYVRTSSETQGESSSSFEQEADCRRLAEEKGLAVVVVYRDVEKYRVGSKLVEPSGSRSDRPGLLAMLKDATRDEFDAILAWREDRLYRGLQSMLTILETIQEYKIEILLAKETFDPKIAPIRAWAAQMELEGMKERMGMGVKARLKAGKANTGQDRYGYLRVGDKIHVVEEEAGWVRKIFEWYNQGVSLSQIRERLIAGNAPQKGSSTPRCIQWARSSIQGILESAREYAYGCKEQSRDGEIYQIPVESIIDIPTYELFRTRREKNKTNSPQQIRHDYLLSGLLKCSCNLTWQARTTTYRRSRKGEWIERKAPIGTYFCPQPHKELRPCTCPKTVSAKQAETQVWEKVRQFIINPDYLSAQAKARVAQLQTDFNRMQRDELCLREEIRKLATERQEFIARARKLQMKDEEFLPQMDGLNKRDLGLKRRLTAMEQAMDAFTELDLEEQFRKYVADLQSEMTELIHVNPQTPEERHQVFLLKKRIVDTVLEEARIDKNREIHVRFAQTFSPMV